MNKYFQIIFFNLIIISALCVYLPGLNADFLFDDYPNLEPLGNSGVVDSWDKAKKFINSGFAGPTGRPVSLASFLLNDNTWPSIAYSFKYTNVMIHLLNGVLLCWATLLLLRNYNYNERQAIWIALIASGIWLLHPYFVSTTLYVVQRMAQLAALFTLIGIIGYLKARLLLVDKPLQAYVYMAVSIGLCTILATYSKENGALLPLLILIIEFCNPDKQNRPIWQWRALCLWMPSCAVLYLIFREINFADNIWPNRNFNQIERLYSESRIVTEYLFKLFIPQIEGRGLYQDGFMVSKSLFQPITTLYSIIFLSGLALAAFALKSRYPLFALAVLFFFAAHLMESTVIGLELYFEHRNYLAALLLFLPVAAALYALKEKIEPKLVYFIIAVIFSILSFFTYERVKLWGNTEQLLLYWAKNSLDSPRAQSEIANHLMRQGKIMESHQHLIKNVERMPDSALLTIQLLLLKVSYNIATNQDFEVATHRLEEQPFDVQAIQGLRILTESIIRDDQSCHKYCGSVLNLVQNLDQNVQYNKISVFWRLSAYLKAKIFMAMDDDKKAMLHYHEAVSRYNDVEAGLMMVAEVGTHSSPSNALLLLKQVNSIYKTQDPLKLRRSKSEYDIEILRLIKVFEDEIKAKA